MKIISTTYRLTMSDGTPFQIRIDDSGKAIEAALRKYRGRTVVLRYAGVTEEDCEKIRAEDPAATPTPGIIRHDIPWHNPISPDAILEEVSPRPAKLPDTGTVEMFEV